ncbi:MAG: hypothetical protein OXN86_04745 [Chloroflexota bacterium]|nr:hypothetical protein [Chloroflexota bacterium]
MSRPYPSCRGEQQYAMLANLGDWLPEVHLTWFAAEAVELRVLSVFHTFDREDG